MFRDVMELLTQRDRVPKNSQTYASVSADMRFKTKQYSSQTQQLMRKVEEDLKQRVMYPFAEDAHFVVNCSRKFRGSVGFETVRAINLEMCIMFARLIVSF